MMSSLYIGSTGLKSQAAGLANVSNNLANVNTVAYKQTSMEFSDLLSSYLASSGSAYTTGLAQSGAGATVGSIRTLFTQGSFEQSNSFTDLALDGGGFFGVSSGSNTYYTRAGNLSFTKDGALVDANGYTVLGRSISNGVESSRVSPIELNFASAAQGGIGSMAGKASTMVRASASLGGLEDRSSLEGNEYFSLAGQWDGTQNQPLAESAYAYSQQVEFQDATGTTRTATLYYDSAGATGGQNVVEYVLAMDPSEDGSALAGTRASGLLLAGTLTFSSSGELTNMTAFTPPGSGDPADTANWKAASLQNGYPAFTVTPTGAESQTIGLDTGLYFSGGLNEGLDTAKDLLTNPERALAAAANATREATASVAYKTGGAVIASSTDGYAAGEMTGMEIGKDGTISVTYNNGKTEDVGRISVFRFTSEDGLSHEGNNLYAATKASGAADEGVAGEENFGSVASYALEQSNVDYATEFTKLITSQRAFQMNSKVITTSDTMLQKALEIKR
ncbi:flagellar hook-basal body complex protein [Desulfovibrio sp. OttesenSCG-928-G15]|nr:flagellar hook-basal body complex protein [Desulfovibrio sp. OttesenSCG-928-G15]